MYGAVFQPCSDFSSSVVAKRFAGKEWKRLWRLSKALPTSRIMLFAV